MKALNETDDFTFLGPFGEFTCKVHYEKGYWWTTTRMAYKCDSLKRLK